jgi:hypothetical protein
MSPDQLVRGRPDSSEAESNIARYLKDHEVSATTRRMLIHVDEEADAQPTSEAESNIARYLKDHEISATTRRMLIHVDDD